MSDTSDAVQDVGKSHVGAPADSFIPDGEEGADGDLNDAGDVVAEAVPIDGADVVADVASIDGADLVADAAPIDVGDLVADYVETLLDISDLDGDIEIDERDGRTYVTVTDAESSNLRVLATGEVVSALQELSRLVVQTRTGDFARLVLDIGGTRDQRSRELAELVRRAGAELAAGADRFELEPMSSYERKLIHDLVAEQGLASHSEGEGGARHTVIVAPGA